MRVNCFNQMAGAHRNVSQDRMLHGRLLQDHGQRGKLSRRQWKTRMSSVVVLLPFSPIQSTMDSSSLSSTRTSAQKMASSSSSHQSTTMRADRVKRARKVRTRSDEGNRRSFQPARIRTSPRIVWSWWCHFQASSGDEDRKSRAAISPQRQCLASRRHDAASPSKVERRGPVVQVSQARSVGTYEMIISVSTDLEIRMRYITPHRLLISTRGSGGFIPGLQRTSEAPSRVLSSLQEDIVTVLVSFLGHSSS